MVHFIIPKVNSFKTFTEFSTWFIADKFTRDLGTTCFMTFAANDINMNILVGYDNRTVDDVVTTWLVN